MPRLMMLSDTRRRALRPLGWVGAVAALGLVLGGGIGWSLYHQPPGTTVTADTSLLAGIMLMLALICGGVLVGIQITGPRGGLRSLVLLGVGLCALSIGVQGRAWKHQTCTYIATHATDVAQLPGLAAYCPPPAWAQGVQVLGGLEAVQARPGGSWALLQGLKGVYDMGSSTAALMQVYVRAAEPGATKVLAEQPLKEFLHGELSDAQAYRILDTMLDAQVYQVWSVAFRQNLETFVADKLGVTAGDRATVHALLFNPWVEQMGAAP